MIGEDKEAGIKRIRIIASIASGGLFFMTAVTQFQSEPIGVMIIGVLISAIFGAGFMWIILTIIKFVIKLIRK